MKLKTVAIAVLALTSGLAFSQSVVTIAHVGPTSGAIAHLVKTTKTAPSWPLRKSTLPA